MRLHAFDLAYDPRTLVAVGRSFGPLFHRLGVRRITLEDSLFLLS